MHEALMERVKERFEERKSQLQGEENFYEACRLFMIHILDKHWKEHLLNMDNLRDHIGLRSYAQADPLVEYNKEAYNYFESMFREVDSEICKGVFTYEAKQPQVSRSVRQRAAMPSVAGGRGRDRGRDRGDAPEPVHTIRRTQRKIKPNEPCPCGSGKKYKKCCGKKA